MSLRIRKWLLETPVFVEMQKRKNLETGIPLATVLAKHRPGVSVSMILTWAWSATIIVILLMTPTILQKNFGIMVSVAQTGNLFATIGLVIGAAIYGWLAGRFGVARVIAFGCAIQSVCYLVLLQVAANGSAFIVPIYALTGLSLGAIGTYPLAWIRSLPARVRFSGISFSYNVAYAIFGSITPVLIGFAVSWNRMTPVWYVAGMGGVAIVTMLVMQARVRNFAISEANI